MHELNLFLVHIPDVIEIDEVCNRKELIYEVRRYALQMTEQFKDTAYDWRTENDAGRWASIYSPNVKFASDDLDWFLNEIKKTEERYEEELEEKIKWLKENASLDLEELTNIIKRSDEYSNELWNFQTAADIITGHYTCGMHFYDTHRFTARIRKNLYEPIKEEPEKWALVFIDQHY